MEDVKQDKYLGFHSGQHWRYLPNELCVPSVSGIFLLLLPASPNRTTGPSFRSDLNRMRTDSSSSSSSSSDSSFDSGRASFSTWGQVFMLKQKSATRTHFIVRQIAVQLRCGGSSLRFRLLHKINKGSWQHLTQKWNLPISGGFHKRLLCADLHLNKWDLWYRVQTNQFKDPVQ